MNNPWIRFLMRLSIFVLFMALGFILGILDPMAGNGRVFHFYSAMMFMGVGTLLSVVMPLPQGQSTRAPRS